MVLFVGDFLDAKMGEYPFLEYCGFNLIARMV